MDDRCAICGFAPEDYRSTLDRRWLVRVLPERVALIFEGFPAGYALPGHGGAREVSAALASAARSEDDLHPAVHLGHEIAAAAAASRLAALDGAGEVVQVNTSRGGVPKLPVPAAEVAWRGLAGDEHREPKHHGHALQALCLWSAEVIERLREEGHPIGFGSAGENVTVRGLDWARARTGAQLRIGTVRCELTFPATPCTKNKGWFLGGDYRRMDHDCHPGWSRWHAAVLEPGEVRTGDVVSVVPLPRTVTSPTVANPTEASPAEVGAAGASAAGVSPSAGRA